MQADVDGSYSLYYSKGKCLQHFLFDVIFTLFSLN